MAHDPEGTVTFKARGKKFIAFFGHKAMKAIEVEYDLPFFKAIQAAMPKIAPGDMDDKEKIAEASAHIRMTDIGNLFGVSLLKHHPDLTEDQIDDLVDEIGLEKASEVIGAALSAALVKEGDDGSPANPPRQRRKTG